VRGRLGQGDDSGGSNPGLGTQGHEPFGDFWGRKKELKPFIVGHELLKNADKRHISHFFKE
jgi:hypothetical protein